MGVRITPYVSVILVTGDAQESTLGALLDRRTGHLVIQYRQCSLKKSDRRRQAVSILVVKTAAGSLRLVQCSAASALPTGTILLAQK